MRTGVDVEDLKICDVGDLNVTDNPTETIERIRLVLDEIISDGKVPVMLGGEHSISLGGVKAADGDVTVVDFDAHMDLRDGYNGEPLSHAAVMRRIAEHLKPERIVQIGTRAICKEELEFAKANHVSSITALQLSRTSMDNNLGLLAAMLRERRQVYLTVDMDVLDPAYAPAVGNPEPGGPSSNVLLSLLEEVCKSDVVAVDLTEVCPHYDTGGTAIQAAKVLFETLCLMEQRRSVR
jgi:agmatinase